MAAYDDVLAFWFPDGLAVDLDTHRRHMEWCMRGGADADIVARFSERTHAAAAGELDGWARTPRGRLALIVVLDQFSRSVYRDSPGAYAQDPKALALSLEGLDNGHYDALAAVWEKFFFTLPLAHAEGPDHLARCDRLVGIAERLLADAPEPLAPLYAFSLEQAYAGRAVIERFGRHPHRNAILGRRSTAEELTFLEKGDFVHTRPVKLDR